MPKGQIKEGVPLCKDCGRRHWNLIPCLKAEEDGVPLWEDVLAERAFKAAHRVIPQAKTHRPVDRTFRGNNFVETGPNVFHRKRAV